MLMINCADWDIVVAYSDFSLKSLLLIINKSTNRPPVSRSHNSVTTRLITVNLNSVAKRPGIVDLNPQMVALIPAADSSR